MLAVLACGVLAGSARAGELERIAAVAAGGATELALRLLDQHHPPLDQQEQWLRFEQQRLTLLADTERWDEISRRVDALPPGLPEGFTQWALLEAAKARLAAEDGAGARRYLRRLIWGGATDANTFANWRRLVIRSYLVDNDVADAHAALLRYKQDYRVNNDAWRLVHAKVLLRAGRNKAAFDLLQESQSAEGRLLRALAGMRSGIYKAVAVKALGLELADANRDKTELEAKAWALVAEAARGASDDVYRVIGLEHALAFPADLLARDAVFTLTADDLWQAYEWLAETLGNRLQLLVGNDRAWFEQARYYESEDKSYARAFYAFLSRRAADPQAQRRAHERLVDSLLAVGREELVRLLYTRAKRFPELTDVPIPVRYRLADLALQRRDVRLAASLLQGLDAPPADEDPDQWRLRLARVLIYAGDFKAGALRLSQILDNKRKLEPAFADRYIQVLFDLQAVNRNEEAYVLLDSTYRLVDERRQRELLFWMADSKGALGEHQQAAELYLRSAYHGAHKGGDPWGQSARFHAAEALGKAGVIPDARRVYQKLLAETADPRQRALIERSIQQLWLRERQGKAQ